MQTVRDGDGDSYLLVKRSQDTCLIRDPRTGEERYAPAADLTVVKDASTLATAASGVSEAVRQVLRAVHSDRSLGLLILLVDDGPITVIDLLDRTDLCESDLHGTIGEFSAAGLISETKVAGHRGYEATARARDGVDGLRRADARTGSKR